MLWHGVFPQQRVASVAVAGPQSAKRQRAPRWPPPATRAGVASQDGPSQREKPAIGCSAHSRLTGLAAKLSCTGTSTHEIAAARWKAAGMGIRYTRKETEGTGGHGEAPLGAAGSARLIRQRGYAVAID